MSTLTLWAIGIDDVRSVIPCTPEAAARLRSAAEQRFATSAAPQPGLLGKLGPFLRRGGDPAAPRPGTPTGEDVDDLLAGRFIPPDRLDRAWTLLDLWLTTLAFASAQWPLDGPQLNDFDFDLARARVPARCGLSELFKAGLGISLTRPPGLAAGWVPGAHVDVIARSWAPAIAELSETHAVLATAILAFLDGFPSCAEQAAATGRPAPDLIAILRTADSERRPG